MRNTMSSACCLSFLKLKFNSGFICSFMSERVSFLKVVTFHRTIQSIIKQICNKNLLNNHFLLVITLNIHNGRIKL